MISYLLITECDMHSNILDLILNNLIDLEFQFQVYQTHPKILSNTQPSREKGKKKKTVQLLGGKK